MPVLGCGAQMSKLMDVSDSDVAVMEDTIAERLGLGVSQAVAQRQAVDEALAQLADERSAVMKAVQEQLAVKEKTPGVSVERKPVMSNKAVTNTPKFKKWFGNSQVLDVDGNPNVAGQFGIRSIPTILFFKGGQNVGQLIGNVPKSQIEEMIRTA